MAAQWRFRWRLGREGKHVSGQLTWPYQRVASPHRVWLGLDGILLPLFLAAVVVIVLTIVIVRRRVAQ